jgi:prevent-host-death family protein
MKTISVSALKAHLSGQLKEVKAGGRVVVLEHNRPIAVLVPYESEALVLREPTEAYRFQELSPLSSRDPGEALDEERAERW